MTNFIIRGFEADDAPEIVKLHKRYDHWFEESELSVDYVLQCSLRHDFRFFVAEYDNVIVGFSGVLFYESVGRAEIGPICVLEAFQKKGVGSELLHAVMDFLRQKSIHRAIAKVKTENEQGIAFFGLNGFKREALLENYTKKDESIIQMVKFL